jgi:hypothetical protein
MEASMAIGIHGQLTYLDVNRSVAVIKQSSMPVSKDAYLDGYSLSGFNAIGVHLSQE